MKKNIFVVGLDEFHLKLLETVRNAERYDFLPLLRSTEIVNPVDCDINLALEKAHRILDIFPGQIDAIIGHWDFPTSTLLPILRQQYGLPGPSLETVLRCEHKYWSRLKQQKVIRNHVPRFAAFNPFAERPRHQIDLDYPFWIKPVKAHSSFLGFRIDNDADFAHAIDEIREKIRCVALPFNQILDHAGDRVRHFLSHVVGDRPAYSLGEGLLDSFGCQRHAGVILSGNLSLDVPGRV
jgi:hypothetical protein